MSEYRIPLEGGDILVVNMYVEEREYAEPVTAEGIGTLLLDALGLGKGDRPVISRPPKKAQMRGVPPAIAAANEEDGDAWLARTSADALKGMGRG